MGGAPSGLLGNGLGFAKVTRWGVEPTDLWHYIQKIFEMGHFSKNNFSFKQLEVQKCTKWEFWIIFLTFLHCNNHLCLSAAPTSPRIRRMGPRTLLRLWLRYQQLNQLFLWVSPQDQRCLRVPRESFPLTGFQCNHHPPLASPHHFMEPV